MTVHAVVVRHADYREHDRMITLFSPEHGRMEVLCRGCRKQKSPLIAAGELFCTGEFVLHRTGDRLIVTSCQVSETYYALREDFDKLAHGMYMLELCAAVIQPEQENERLFLFLLRCLAHLCYGHSETHRVTAVFLMGLVSLLGFRPPVGRCARCGKPLALPQEDEQAFVAFFSAEEGGVLCPTCGAGQLCRLRVQDVRYLQNIMKKGVLSLEEEGTCPKDLFEALRRMAEGHADLPIRSGRMLD